MRVFYGWYLVGAAFLLQMVGTGAVIYTYSVVAVPLGETFEASRMTMMLGVTAMTLAGGVLSPFLGARIDGGSLKGMVLVGAVALAVGYCLLSVTTASWQVPIIYALVMSLAANLLGPLTASTLLARWFNRRRGLALGVAAVGTSVGGFLFPPLVQWLIDTLEWRVALRVLGLGGLVVMLPVVMMVVNRPEDRQLHPDGADEPLSMGSLPPPLSSKQLLRSREFWLIAVAIGILFGVYTALLSNLVPFARDLGISSERGALLISAIALAGIVGKLLFGAVADAMDLRLALAIAALLCGLGLGCYLGAEGYTALLLGSVSLGLAAGGMLPVWGALLAVLFGALNYGRVMGMMNPVMMPIVILAPPLAGLVHDRAGSYTPAFAGFLAALLITLALLPFIRLKEASPSTP